MRAQVLLLGTLIACVSCSPSHLAAPTPQQCEVVRDYWGARDKSNLTFLNKGAYPIGEVVVGTLPAPSRFETTKPEPMQFDYDATPLRQQMLSGPAQDLHTCFRRAHDRPREFGRQALWPLGKARSENGHGEVEIWSISRIAISADGSRALFFREVYCGPMCGEGAYIAMARRGGVWEESAKATMWVS